MDRTRLVELGEQIQEGERAPVDRHGNPGLEAQLDLAWRVGSFRRIGRPYVHVVPGRDGRILERPALVADVPQVLVARIQLLLVDSVERDAVRPRIGQGVLARGDVPFPPRRDHPQVGSQRGERDLEPKLVVPLPRASVGKGVSAGPPSHLDHASRDEGARHGGAEQVLSAVDRSRSENRKHVVGDELFPEIFAKEGRRPGGEGLAGQLVHPTPLPHVGGHADDIGAMVFAKPRHDDRSVQAPGVSEHDLHGWVPSCGSRLREGRRAGTRGPYVSRQGRTRQPLRCVPDPPTVSGRRTLGQVLPVKKEYAVDMK